MGCWLKKYGKGYRWYCNTSGTYVSPQMSWEIALLSNIIGSREPSIFPNSDKDARCISDWKQAKKEATQLHKTLTEKEYNKKVGEFYGEIFKETDAW